MRTTIVILLLALLCVASFARHDLNEGRRRFRPSRDDVPEDPSDDPYGNNSGNNENDNGEEDLNNEDSWRGRHHKNHKRHHQARDETEDTNNESNVESSNTESNESNNQDSNTQDSNTQDSNTQDSNTQDSNTQDSNTQDSNTQDSNTQASNTQESTSSSPVDGHLKSDTFASTDYNGDAEFKQQCLDIHNDERATLGIDPVTYNDDLATAAKAWAEKLVEAGTLSHSPNRVHVGENVGYRTHRDTIDSTPLLIDAWIAEKQDFKNGVYPDISTTGSVSDVGHYSQLIWSTTKEIGCAVVNGGGRDYMVCQYAPSGNRLGETVY